MTHPEEALFGQSPHSARKIFNAICAFFFISAEKIRLEKLLGAGDDSQPEQIFLHTADVSVVKSHADIASRLLALEAQGFLTDEQNLDLQHLRVELTRDWNVLLKLWEVDDKALPATQVLRRIDALFLSQLEWMKDVEFESCSPTERIKIFSESPLADLMVED